jgi:ABC-2 type transport system permease protein
MKILATIRKEWLTLMRDAGGLLLIFLMPLLLVTVMSLVQDAPFKDYTQMRFEILCVNEDRDSLGHWIEQTLTSSGAFVVTDTYHGKPLTDSLATSLVQHGDYKAYIHLPPSATDQITRKTEVVVQSLMAGFGITAPPSPDGDSQRVVIRIVFDPITKANFRQSLLFGVEKITASAQSRLLMATFAKQIKNMSGDSSIQPPDLSQMVQVTEQRSSLGFDTGAMSSVQHNVPAWTMFAMFFILFPLAGNFIKEREDGSILRLNLISGSQFPFILGKCAFHFMVCMVQFLVMMGVGLYIMPLLGLPKLVIGGEWGHIALAAAAISLCATSYAMWIATAFRTHNQALAFGSTSVVILAAIGGVWVPTFVMPAVMQQVSQLSPLAWGLELCNHIFLRHSPLSELVPYFFRLIVFSLVCLGTAYWLHSRKGE